MTINIALLRAVNVGGRGNVSMPDLKNMFAALGFAHAQSLLQSGNIVFESDSRNSDDLERLLEKETVKRLALTADYFVRSASQWAEIVTRNPFPDEAKDDPSHLVALVMKKAPGATEMGALRTAIQGHERVEAKGKLVYIVYPDGIGRSKLTNTVIERVLGCRGTGRNWNTVLKLQALTERE